MSVANLKKRAKRLLRDARSGIQPSLWRFKKLHPAFTNQTLDEIQKHVALADAQLVIAREWDFRSWPHLLESYELSGDNEMTTKLQVQEMIPFIPSKDFAASVAFYTEIFEANWQTDNLCQIQAGQSKFLIQDFYEPEYANNCMYQLMVDDVGAIWEQLRDSGLLNRHGDVRATPPKKEEWGTVVYLWGPGGELWHITEPDQTAA